MEDLKRLIDKQHPHWESAFSDEIDRFGSIPSQAAEKAINIFKSHHVNTLLELGGGQGRDTIYFAKKGFHVYVLDYTKNGIKMINKKAKDHGLENSITAIQHDIRNPLPFDDNFFPRMLFSHAFMHGFFSPRTNFSFQGNKKSFKAFWNQ